MWDDKIGPIELVIFLLIAFVLPFIVIAGDDRNWHRKAPKSGARERRTQEASAADADLASGQT
jgi:hypothetical protein